jgi:hypothetical protein
MLSMPTGTSNVGNGNELFGRTQQKINPMMFEEKPGYMAPNQNEPMDEKMSPLSDFKLNDDIKQFSFNAKGMMGFGGPSKNSISSFLDGGSLLKARGKPIGILGNILKASQAMPTGRIVKPSTRSDSWFNDGPFSRRHTLERSKSVAPAVPPGSPSVKHTIKKHKQISKVYQKSVKKTLSKKLKL